MKLLKGANRNSQTHDTNTNFTSCPSFWMTLFSNHRDASDQKFRRKDGTVVNQQIKAIPVAVSNCTQWLCAQLSRSLSIRIVMPADAQAAANVRVEVTCMDTCLLKLTLQHFQREKLTQLKAPHVWIMKLDSYKTSW